MLEAILLPNELINELLSIPIKNKLVEIYLDNIIKRGYTNATISRMGSSYNGLYNLFIKINSIIYKHGYVLVYAAIGPRNGIGVIIQKRS